MKASRKYIIKFDLKNNQIRMDLYLLEGIRVEGRCKQDYIENPSEAQTYNVLKNLYLQFESEFKIGFKRPCYNSYILWLKNNVYRVQIRNGINNKYFKALDRLLPNAIVVND